MKSSRGGDAEGDAVDVHGNTLPCECTPRYISCLQQVQSPPRKINVTNKSVKLVIFDEIDSDGNGSYLKVAAPEKANNVKMDRIP